VISEIRDLRDSDLLRQPSVDRGIFKFYARSVVDVVSFLHFVVGD
jgi:hypothetical protein